MSSLKNKTAPKGGGGGNFSTEVPSEDNHKAAVVAVIELGTHSESFQGAPPKPKHKILIAWEILDEKQSNGDPFILAEVMTFSTHENAFYREVWEACRGKVKQDSDIVGQDPECLLGMPCTLTIGHAKAKELKEGETELRTYVNLDGIIPADRADRLKVQKTVNIPFLWDLANPAPFTDHDWLPYVYDRSIGKRVPVSDMIARSAERRGKAGGQKSRAQSGADEADPFEADGETV